MTFSVHASMYNIVLNMVGQIESNTIICPACLAYSPLKRLCSSMLSLNTITFPPNTVEIPAAAVQTQPEEQTDSCIVPQNLY